MDVLPRVIDMLFHLYNTFMMLQSLKQDLIWLVESYCLVQTSLKSDHYLRSNTNHLLKKENQYSFPKLFLKATRQTLYFRFPLVSEKYLIQ